MESREGNEVLVRLLARRVGNGQNGVPNLLDIDGAREGGLLCIVALEVDAGGDVRDAVCSRRWMVAVPGNQGLAHALLEQVITHGCCLYAPDLLADQLGGSRLILPLAKK